MVVSDQYTAIAGLPSLRSRVIRDAPQASPNPLPTPTITIDTVDLPDLSLEQRLLAATRRDTPPPFTGKLPNEYVQESRILFDTIQDQHLYLSKLCSVVDMGFEVEAASRALLECRLEEGAAVERLLRDC